jgi:hypothetical protein
MAIDRLLEEFRFDPVPIRLTATMLEKSIIDARGPLRALLKKAGLVEYDAIKRGNDHKIRIPLPFISAETAEVREVGFYRPVTKQGDPRFWVEKLGSIASSGELLIFAFSEIGVALILIKGDADALAEQAAMHLPSRFEERGRIEAVVRELSGRLARIQGRWHRTLRPGPTGVGFALESQKDIKANISQLADYKGVELKA